MMFSIFVKWVISSCFTNFIYKHTEMCPGFFLGADLSFDGVEGGQKYFYQGQICAKRIKKIYHPSLNFCPGAELTILREGQNILLYRKHYSFWRLLPIMKAFFIKNIHFRISSLSKKYFIHTSKDRGKVA